MAATLLLYLVLPIAVSAASHWYALRPELAGATTMWLALAGPHALLAGLALYRTWDDGTLLDELTPRYGDPSLGILTGGALVGGAWLVLQQLSPPGATTHPWLLHLWVQVGPAGAIRGSLLLTGGILLMATMEELTWRSLVLNELRGWIGDRWAWLASAALYALATAPAAVTLADPQAGLNPLLPIAAFGCGMVWAFQKRLVGRLPPVVVSHAVFTYALTALPTFRPF